MWRARQGDGTNLQKYMQTGVAHGPVLQHGKQKLTCAGCKSREVLACHIVSSTENKPCVLQHGAPLATSHTHTYYIYIYRYIYLYYR